jgi:tRNA-splicing ligase RtcB (3'-phosphate/5'-hydroxy nucleic acid ligase)
LGHGIASWFLKAAGAKEAWKWIRAYLMRPANSERSTFQLELGGAYAYTGRYWVCSRAAKMLGATVLEEVHNYGDSTPVLHQLTPVGIAMASAKEFDLYRD